MKRYYLPALGLICFLFLSFTGFAQNLQQFEKEIQAYEKADQANPPKKGGIVFTGSSSIRLWGDLDKYFPGKTILNRGFGGSQTDQVVYNAGRIILPYQPKQVVIYVGDNDLAAGKTAEKVFSDFQELFRKIRQGNAKTTVTFISIKPSPSRMHLIPQILQANTLIRDFLESQKNTSYVDIFTPMLRPNQKPRPELFRADSLHMTTTGYDVWAKVLKPYLK